MDNTANTNSVSNLYKAIDHIKASDTRTVNEGLGLGWHKFLIYFALWASGIVNILLGCVMLYFIMSMSFYFGFGFSKGGLTIYALTCIIMGIWAIVTRFKLANFSHTGPQNLMALQVLGLVLPILIDKVFGLGIGVSWGVVIGSLAGIFINNAYYTKRKRLFVI